MIISGETFSNPSLPIRKTPIMRKVRSPFEGNYVHIRSRSKRVRYKWVLEWKGNNLLTNTEYQALMVVMSENNGSLFSWTDTYENQTFTDCFFPQEEPETSLEIPVIDRQGRDIEGYWACTVEIESQ